MNQLAQIKQTLNSPEIVEKMTLALNGNREKALKHASSVYTEIQKTAGDSKKDLTGCTPHSLVQCMVDAANMQVSIDGRQHAHIVKYGKNATLQLGYRAYLAKVKEHYPDADIVVKPIYEGDNLEVFTKDSVPTYNLTQADPFKSGKEGMIGVLVACTYTAGDKLTRKIETVPMERINRAKSAAKQQFIWNSDFVEKAKAAAIKNAFKIMFAEIQGLQEAVTYDNEHNYEMKDVTPKQDDDLKQALIEPDVIEVKESQ